MVAGLVALAMTAVAAGCATTPAPVAKIVAGRVVLARPIHPDAYEHVARAQLFQEEERWEEAIAELERAISFDHDAPELHAQIAELELELGREDRAAKAAEESLGIAETPTGLIALAHVRQRRHDAPGAVSALRRATEITSFADEGDLAASAYLELADAQIEALDLEGARATLRELADQVPAQAVARIRVASVAGSLGAMKEVEDRLHEALAIEPNHIEALLTLAWLATASGKLDDAHARFSEALERAEGALDVATAFARFLVLAGKPAEAAQLADDLAPNGDDETLFDRIELCRAAHRLERALTLAQERRLRSEISIEMAARLDLVIADLLDEKSPNEAVAVLLRIPRTAPAFTSARLRASELRREAGQYADARRLLGEIETDPPSESLRDDIVVAQATLDEKMNAPTAAGARLATAIGKRPKSARLRLAYAGLLERQGQVPEALAQAEALLADEPGNAEALNFWGFLAVEHQVQLPRATRRIQAALSFDPGSGAILDSLGWAHLQAGNVSEATPFLEQAQRLEPEDPEILAHLALLLERQGQRERALVHVKKALGRAPSATLKQRLEGQLLRLEGEAKATKGEKTK